MDSVGPQVGAELKRNGFLAVFYCLLVILIYVALRFGSSEDYFYLYWTLALVDAALQLALAYELATHVFQPLGAWAPDVRRSFIVL